MVESQYWTCASNTHKPNEHSEVPAQYRWITTSIAINDSLFYISNAIPVAGFHLSQLVIVRIESRRNVARLTNELNSELHHASINTDSFARTVANNIWRHSISDWPQRTRKLLNMFGYTHASNALIPVSLDLRGNSSSQAQTTYNIEPHGSTGDQLNAESFDYCYYCNTIWWHSNIVDNPQPDNLNRIRNHNKNSLPRSKWYTKWIDEPTS